MYGATYLHKFTFFNGTPDEYRNLLVGKEVRSAIGKGFFVDVCFDDDLFLSIFDGVNMRYGYPGDLVPSKYQMLITSMMNRSFASPPACTEEFMFSVIR